ncbi:radical SAM protein [Spirochaetia bacterium]|nr:radical SAM protein [Spirochaetia bacterium]
MDNTSGVLSALYTPCALCPRACGTNRTTGVRGRCGETAELRLASASLHRGEEPPITGSGGSGTIFVTGCNLGCVFCQNYQISREGMGRAVSSEEFAAIALRLQEQGAENINIVTGSHAVPAIARGIDAARSRGLRIPVLWNSSAYESPAMLDLLKSRVDVYLPDLKTLDSALAGRYFNAPDYPRHAAAAIFKMLEARELRYNKAETTLISGVIIRHLVLPGHLESTRELIRWFAEHCRGKALLSLMTQYTPVGGKNTPGRYINQGEYGQILSWLEDFDIEDGFCQELVTGNEWLPNFERPNPFSSDLSVPIWHWKAGFIQ